MGKRETPPGLTTDLLVLTRRWIHSDRQTIFFEQNGPMSEQINVWVRLKVPHLPFKPFRIGHVIRIHPGDILSPSKLNALVQSCRQPLLPTSSMHHVNPSIVELTKDQACFISGPIINDDQFPI
jgi:hypothetical protein